MNRSERVNVVANLDLPPDAATYMHRVGRTGRFGTHGLAVTFLTSGELRKLCGFLHEVSGGEVGHQIHVVPISIRLLLLFFFKYIISYC